MKLRYLAGFAVGMWLWMAGCSDTPAPPPDTRAADEKAIRSLEAQWVDEFKAKDADKIAGHYADSATLMAPGAAAAKGGDAIAAQVKGMLADRNLALTFTANTVEVAKSGDIAYSQGTYSMTSTNPRTKKAGHDTGTYVTVYKKQADGGWKAIEDISTNDPPPAAPAKAAKKARRKR